MIEAKERITMLNRFINSERFLHDNLIQHLEVLAVFHKQLYMEETQCPGR